MKKTVFIMSILSSLFSVSCVAFGKNTPSDKHIISFEYHYIGTIGANSHSYHIDAKTQPATLMVEDMLADDYGVMKGEVSEQLLSDLDSLCEAYKVYRWDGYDEVAKGVCDGRGFSLYVTYADGTRVSVHGMNSAPKDFYKFERELKELFKAPCEQLYEEARQKKIAQGINGNLTSMMVNFIQKGTSGSDRYEIYITRENIRNDNFSVKIHSVSGTVFPEGDYMYYCHLQDDAIAWADFEKLIKKHDLIQWYNYDKPAEDYNNAEWFQVSFGFSDNMRLNACGTEHPQNYDAFRKDFLTLLRKNLKKAQNNYGLREYGHE